MKPSLKVITLGCSKNTVDTEHLLGEVSSSYEIIPEGEECDRVDVEIINTCGFIGDAKQQSIDTILEEAALKAAGKIGSLMVMGCLSQRYPDELPALIPEVDKWFGARDLGPVVKALGCSPSGRPLRHITDKSLPYAYLKISEGCDRRCSYCAIPLIRGKHVSRPVEELTAEAEALAAEGVKELIIIAQDITFYGLDLYRRRALKDLLQALSKVDGIEWLRLHYSYPADFPEDVLDEMASNPKVCRYMDIPLQHISDTVLENMHRGVSGKATRELIARMRERVPGVALRTTLIVGHPGEGRKEFLELMDFVREARFERMGAFTYSEEEGTWGAGHLRDSVAKATKQRRLDALMALQGEISSEINASRIGSVEKVLIDSFNEGIFVARSEFESPEVDGEILVRYTPEEFDGIEPYSFVGEFINVRITGADRYDLIAERVK
ncbi:MAG: 30S ribosomal protein S12 methylthiotransferase RimO [Bacteroidales bacterium]|nr:30S ribosomal protein S12 methylthiotransferase RimO [Bacteroidales bacterium]